MPEPLLWILLTLSPSVFGALGHAVPERAVVAPSLLSLVTHREHRHRGAHRHRAEYEQSDLDAEAGLLPGGKNATPPALMLSTTRPNPWKDAKPVEKFFAFFLSGFEERPTSTLPPTQASLDVVLAGCPVVLAWPLEVTVMAYNPCYSSREPTWRDAVTGKPLVEYSQSCHPFHSGVSSVTTYRLLEGGNVLSQTQIYTTLTGNRFGIMDCKGNVRYVLEEKVWHQPGAYDAKRCEKYGSCDGVVWIQYFIYKDDKLVAQTPYLHIFESTLPIVDPKTGLRIATAKRIGQWGTGYATDCVGDRKWHLVFAPPQAQPPTPFAVPTEQWPLAAMLSIISQRDNARRPSGFVTPSLCEIWEGFATFFFFGLVVVLIAVGILVVLRDVVPPLKAGLYELELRLCYRRKRVRNTFFGLVGP